MAASSVTPQPGAPLPTTRMSSGLLELAPTTADFWTVRDGTTALGSLIVSLTDSKLAGPMARSLEDKEGRKRIAPPQAVTATAAVARVGWRRRQVAVAGVT